MAGKPQNFAKFEVSSPSFVEVKETKEVDDDILLVKDPITKNAQDQDDEEEQAHDPEFLKFSYNPKKNQEKEGSFENVPYQLEDEEEYVRSSNFALFKI